MELPLLLLLLVLTGLCAGRVLGESFDCNSGDLAASLCVFVSPEMVPYTPQITAKSLEGKLTATTFTLDQPICIFDQYVNSTDDIWLVVAFTNVTSHFKNPTSKIQIPPYQKLSTALHYMTLKTSLAFYPCAENRATSVLRVGSDTSCKDDRSLEYCNGPLPHPGPYRVKFLILDTNGSKAETRWSQQIMLKQGRKARSIDTWPGRRSGTMVVITSILSSFIGVLVILFLCTVAYECFKLWRREEPAVPEEPRAGSFREREYDTHHIPPSQAPPQPPSDVPRPHSPAASP
ncbi:uroplakin-3b [Mauremys reevesii]|uniref:uroplakin-3b n=1 Tax=Mauremys reevesii TaxID=260615 RepID=UPI00193F63BD|nr:uroplakin-3b [Mauremys reevesii]